MELGAGAGGTETEEGVLDEGRGVEEMMER